LTATATTLASHEHGTIKLRQGSLKRALDQAPLLHGTRITVVGLPADWIVLVDEKLSGLDHVFMGAGCAPNATPCFDLAQ
jgi:hypothetical protein